MHLRLWGKGQMCRSTVAELCVRRPDATIAIACLKVETPCFVTLCQLESYLSARAGGLRKRALSRRHNIWTPCLAVLEIPMFL